MVVGLGNPGRRYEASRHNVGFMVADEVLRRWRSGRDRQEYDFVVAVARLSGVDVLVVKPQTYMNLSGEAVEGLASHYGYEAADLLLIYDDADLPFGRIRIRPSGGSAGHHGMGSIIKWMETNDIMRIRLGIGRDDGELSNRVLAPFTKEEKQVVDKMVGVAADAVEVISVSGVHAAMNRFN